MKALHDKVKVNQRFWWALKHRREGWWFGNSSGVVCYEDHELAMAANTILYGRSEGKVLFRIMVFTGAERYAGEHTPPLSLEDGMKWLRVRGRI